MEITLLSTKRSTLEIVLWSVTWVLTVVVPDSVMLLGGVVIVTVGGVVSISCGLSGSKLRSWVSTIESILVPASRPMTLMLCVPDVKVVRTRLLVLPSRWLIQVQALKGTPPFPIFIPGPLSTCSQKESELASAASIRDQIV